jgi:transposase InsO family protein
VRRRGFVYLAAAVDWYSRRVLAHRVPISMEADFCCEVLDEALARCGTPRSSTAIRAPSSPSETFTDILKQRGIAIGMGGKGAWRHNVFVERLWRSVRHGEVYLKACASTSEAKTSLSPHFVFYNARRSHGRLSGPTRGPQRVIHELRLAGVDVSPSGVRGLWVRHGLPSRQRLRRFTHEIKISFIDLEYDSRACTSRRR